MEAKQNGLNFEAEKKRIETELAVKAALKAANKEAAKLISAGMGIAEVRKLLDEKFPEIEHHSAITTAVRARLIVGEIALSSKRKAEKAAKEAAKAEKLKFRHNAFEIRRAEFQGLHRQKYRQKAGKFCGKNDEIWVNQPHIGVPYLCNSLEAAASLAKRIGDETDRNVRIYRVMAVKHLCKGGIKWVEHYLDDADCIGEYAPLLEPGRQMASVAEGFPFWPAMGMLR